MDKQLKFTIAIAKQAGKIIRRNFSLNMKKEWKQDKTPLTATDKAVNDLVLRQVATEFPGHAVLSEEGNLENIHSEFVWVCDPVDGTIPFSHGIPVCVFSLALVHRGIPVIGVVCDPFMDRVFSAMKGEGAQLDGRQIRVSDKNDLARGLIGIGYAWNQVCLRDLSHEIIMRKAATVQLASNVYMGSLVGAGEFLAVIFSGKLPWDVAALKVIVEEAGGRVTDLWGSEQRYDRKINGAIISNGRVHDLLIGLVHTSVANTPREI